MLSVAGAQEAWNELSQKQCPAIAVTSNMHSGVAALAGTPSHAPILVHGLTYGVSHSWPHAGHTSFWPTPRGRDGALRSEEREVFTVNPHCARGLGTRIPTY